MFITEGKFIIFYIFAPAFFGGSLLEIEDDMRKLAAFTIPFAGLKQGKHKFDFQIDREFFQSFEYDEFHNARVNIDLLLEKKSTMMELLFKASGTVNVDCDLTGEVYDQPIDGELILVIKFGDEFNDDNEELLILPHGEFQVNVAQYIYELIVLSVPLKRVHPGVLDGSLKSDILDKLEELSPRAVEDKEEIENGEDVDPRWNKLKNLLND